MGRPRHGTRLKRTITLSLSTEAIEHLDARGPNRSAAAENIIALSQQAATLDQLGARKTASETLNAARAAENQLSEKYGGKHAEGHSCLMPPPAMAHGPDDPLRE